MTDSLLTLHIQLGMPHWIKAFIALSGVRWMKCMDPGDQEPFAYDFPSLNWIVRFFEDEGTAKREVLMGKAGAKPRLDRVRGELQKRPWLSKPRFYVEHMNEPSNALILKDRAGRQALDYFTAEYTRLLYEEFGIRSCGYCFGVGHPEPEHVPELFGQGIAALLKYKGIWSMHEYNWPTVLTTKLDPAIGAVRLETHLTLRHRRIIRALAPAWPEYELPRLHITEAGIDRLLVGPRGGWRVVDKDPKQYVRQLLGYQWECQKSPSVEAIYLYTASPGWEWDTYGIYEADAEVYAYAIRTGTVP